MEAVLAALVLLAAQSQDFADQLRRQELGLRLEELASSGKLEGLSKAVLRELRGRRIDGAIFDLCWKIVAIRRWDGKLEEFVVAWDKVCVTEPAAPGQLLFRARLESLGTKPKPYRDLLEAAAKRFPGEPAILWHLGKARFDAADYAPAAKALEDLAPLAGFTYDPDDFHRMLALSYAQDGRRAAALEHLRAIRDERIDFVDLAALATKCRIPEEAARCYRLAMIGDPERISLRMGLIRALVASGDEAAAAVERRQMFSVDGNFMPGKVEDYFFLLPSEGRVEEITRTLRELLAEQDPLAALKRFDGLVVTVPTEDRASVAAAWEKSAGDARSWIILGHMRRAWGNRLEQMIDVLEKGEKLFPGDPLFLREKIEPLRRLSRFPEVAAAYARLVELDPDGKRSGARPAAAVQEAIGGLIGAKDVGAALRLGVLALSEPAMDDATRTATRVAMKPACEASGPEFWDEVRKLKLAPAAGKVDEAIRSHLPKLSDDEFGVRSEASRELRKIGLPAIPALLEHIDDKDIEVRSRAKEIIRAILSE
jgi:tetratricopeptide (TPR) repeat protein